MREIGSEFWTGCTPASKTMNYSMRPAGIYSTHRFNTVETLSGRTALEHIVEILKGIGKKSACLPSYCCHTMIKPFVSHGIKVEFYDVVWTGTGLHREIDLDTSAEVILLLDYFGYTDSETLAIAMQAKAMGKVVVYDATHSMYSRVNTSPYDFVYGSYRKWVDINCGFLCWKTSSEQEEITQNDNSGTYALMRKTLFDRKAAFVNHGSGAKDDFLPLVGEAEKVLERDYHHRLPDKRSMEVLKASDAEFIKKRRMGNARKLAEAVNDMGDDRVRCVNPLLNAYDTPLFVPVMVKPPLRDDLRKFLVSQDIYCPVHWPLSDLHEPMKGASRLFESELSLVCDQRYDESDMDRIAEAIANYLKRI